ncbi:MAG: glycosyltransferase family 39 protein [Burkholderiaceae bacterium]|nr:glycosyltransferase family 39 protein [Burkholderiaceae bacterium]
MHRKNLSPTPVPPAVPPWIQGVAWCVLAVLWLGSLGARALISPDEGRYATLALGMLQSGDWLTPRLNGFLYFEKPILPYWMGALSLQLFGLNEFGARFWPGFTGLMTVVAVAWTARRLWDELAGHCAGLVAAGSTWIIANSHFLSLDMGLTFFLTLALCAFLVAQRDGVPPTEQRYAMWLCWAAMAGATLSKGLIGLVIPGAALVLYSLVQRQFGFWRRMHWGTGLLLFFALTAPWFVAVSLENPGFFDFFFVREHFRRFLTDEARRTGTVTYFLPYLLVGLLPWTTLLPGMFRRGLQGERGAVFQPLRLLGIWSLFILVFFSVSRSKLPSYILPMFPALALVAGRLLSLLRPAQFQWHLLLPMLLWLAILVAAPFVDRWVGPDVPREALQSFTRVLAWAAALFLLAAVLAWYLLRRERLLAALALVALGSVLAVTVALVGHDRYGGQLKSSKAVVPQLAPYLQADTEVFSVRYYDQTLPFYLRRPVTLVDYRDEFSFGQDAEPTRWLPTLDAFVARWQRLPRAAAMMSQGTYQELLQQDLPMRIAYQDPYRLVVVKPEGLAP